MSRSFISHPASLLLIASFTCPPALADRQATEIWRQECGACHIAYPPGLLPANAWRSVMAGLKNHFGTDASLEPAQQNAVTDLLVRQAGHGRVDPAAPLRITRSRWFLHEHDEIRPGVWQRASVKSPANCQVCHRQAEQGDFEEHRVRIPR